jgi:DNA-binding CsgD family transcriptional regulator
VSARVVVAITESEPTVLHERSRELKALAGMLASVAESGSGRLVLVPGEAGIGKTALLRRFVADVAGETRVLWGTCDELFTPRPLGPFVEIADQVGGQIAELVRTVTTPFDVATSLAAALGATPTVVVLEDAHLADEATLDVLRIIGARLASVPALFVVTYRDDAIGRWHPLRIVLGEIGVASGLKRMRLPPLSPAAVEAMAAPTGTSAGDLYRATAGNPFFVTEVLAAPDARIPETVRDAVLGRAARLSQGARRLLDGIAVLRPQSELWLLEAFAGDDLGSLDEAVASGIVRPGDGAVAFRHELGRLAVEDAIPLHRRQQLHRRALELLSDAPGGERDPGRLAHHAMAVGDAALVLEFAPLAATQASAMGAHREAAAHYRGALRFAELIPPEVRGALYRAAAYEAFLIDDFGRAVEAQRQALACYEQLGDRREQGTVLTFLSQLLWLVGSLREGLAAMQRAVGMFADLPPAERVRACAMMAALHLAAEAPDSALRWAERAGKEAEKSEHDLSRIEALMAAGWVEYFSGRSADKVVRALESAEAMGAEAVAAMCYVIIVRTACRRREYDVAEPYLRAGLEYCVARDFDVWRYYLLSWQSKVQLARGSWTEAAHAAQICLGEPCPFARIHALVAIALVRARRGDPDVWGPLDEALELATPRRELQWMAPVVIARAEAAWLEGRHAEVLAETEACSRAAAGTWYAAGLAYWRERAGADEPLPEVGEPQYRLEMAGDWAAASESWRASGCPYEAAFALLDGDEDALRRALDELRELGAAPAARLAERRLRARGARGVPRGPRPRTRDNPAGLTPRELEVLEHLAEGLRNAEIADLLVVSERTVDHHVSAILRKLDVRSRGQAVAAAARWDQ